MAQEVVDQTADTPSGGASLGVISRAVCADYGGDPVLRSVDLDVAPGEIVALLGPSGCGKTTLLRCIAGLETPTAGTICIGDRDVTAGRGVAPEHRRVGMVFQDGALFPHRSVGDNVGYGLPRRERRGDRTRAALRLVGLEATHDRMPGTLSGGEQQRVAVARALAPAPGVLLLDEPFSSLDAGLRAHLRADVHRLLKGIGVTTILVTHDQEEALTFGDRVAVLRRGEVAQVGSPEDIYRRPASPWVARFVGEAALLPATMADSTATTVIGPLPLGTPAPSGAGTVLCRPEQLLLEAGGTARVIDAAYFGRDTRYDVALADGSRVVARAAGAPVHAEGDSVTVRFTGGPAHAWPAPPPT